MRSHAPFLTLLVVILLGVVPGVSAQTKYWTGGSGNWSDATHWSLAPNGPGGAGVPRMNEDVVITPATNATITLRGTAWCRDLVVDASERRVVIAGPADAELNIAGAWRVQGRVEWAHVGNVRMVVRRAGTELDLRGVPLGCDLEFDGSGSWSVVSDLVVDANKALILKQGTLIANGSLIKAGQLRLEGRATKRLLGGTAVVMLERPPALLTQQGIIDPGSSTLVVGGMTMPWPEPAQEAGGDRDVNVCGTGPGQTPFILTSSVTTDYNGFGVSCRNACDATVTVSVDNGVGPFVYQWLNGGPATATWTSACGGPQIVIVTDVGQGISCPVTVTVTEPAPLGVIFFGPGTPPTCPDVCDGSRTALGVGGVSPINYDWNNGAGTNSSFFELCPGLNTLSVTDANGCQFDTTFFFDLQPLQPNLLFSPSSCFGVCDGTAEVAPAGGTQPYTIDWSPVPPAGQGTPSVSGLCAGNWSVTITDFNGCDTTVSFIIDQPPPIIADVSTADASCSGTCDGTASVIASGAPGPFVFNWTPEPGAGQGTGVVSGLCAGTYQVTITDQSTGCDSLVIVAIDAPEAIDLQGVPTDAGCSGSCDGSIVLSPSGGQPPYAFLWTPAPASGQGTSTVSGLCAGDWSVTVTDAAGCDTTVTYTIAAPPPLEPGLVTVDVACAGDCDGQATANVTGGTAPFLFLWSPAPPAGQGTPAASGLCAGNWSLTVTDANGCDTTIVFMIDEPPLLEAVPSQTDVSCGGACDGAASVSVSGGTPGYTYQWSPAPPVGQGTPDASGLCAGVWNVLITDASGCELPVGFTILDPSPITLSLQVDDASCPGVCDGAAGVIATGGSAPYTYLWQPEPGGGQGGANATGLCPQSYTLTMTDALGCDTTIAFTIASPDAIEANAVVTDAVCAGACDGSIALSPTGGTGTFGYIWDPAPPVGQGTATASGLCAGTWAVTITSGSCDTTLTFLVQEPPAIDASLQSTPVTCSGGCDGAAFVTVTGGTAPYGFVWDPAPSAGQGTEAAQGLCGGSYTVLVSDAAGCDTTIAFIIPDAVPLVVDLTWTEAGCGTLCAGTATASVSGGLPPYTYLWSPEPGGGQGSSVATGLCPGFHDLTVIDAAGCDTTVQFLIVAPADVAVTTTVNDATCAGSCDGSVSVVASGGVPPYVYTWSPEPPVGQGSPAISGLCAGEWLLQISDAAACDTFLVVTIGEPSPIVPDGISINETCNGPCDGSATVSPTGGTAPYSFIWSPAPPQGQGTSSASGLCPGEWTVTISDASGCDTTAIFNILPVQSIDVGLVLVDGPCAGTCGGSATASPVGGQEPYTYNWVPEPGAGQGTASVSGLCAGPWQLTVTDAAGCDTTIAFLVTTPPPFDVALVSTPEDCSGPCTGAATVTASGGAGPISILWQPAPGGGQGTTTASGLCAGVAYAVTLTDVNGCDTTVAFTIDPFEAILANSSSTPASCAGSCDGTATVGPTGGLAPYTYQWTPEPASGQGTPQAAGLCAGPVEVTITDANGCSITETVLITAPEPLLDNATVTQVLCGGACTGGIVLTPTGGAAPYQFNWSPEPPDGQGTASVSGLCAGTWSVTVTDAAGCDSTFNFDITEPDPIALSLTMTPSQCLVCSGGAQLVLSGGTPFFLVVWTDDQGNTIGIGDNVSGLCAGLYAVTVTDANGCTAQLPVPIGDTDGEVLTSVPGTTNCPGACDGVASVQFVCNVPPCLIAWTDAAGNDLGATSAEVADLCPGDYIASVTNGAGCVSFATVAVSEAEGVTALISSTPVGCAGTCDGSATIGISGGTPPYTFNWSPEPGGGQGTPFATGLCEGVYTVSIGDGAGCSEEFTVLITAPVPLAVDAAVVDVGCAGACDGSITLAPSGGTAPYTFIWSPIPPNGQGSSTATGLCAGDWSVVVTDANGCTFTADHTIIGPQPLTVTAVAGPSSCLVCNGTVSATVQGGVAPYTYAWSIGGAPAGNDADLTGLCSGLYLLLVSDANGCTEQITVAVPDSDGEVLTVTDGQTTCADDCDGQVSVSFPCNAPPCSVAWSDADGVPIAAVDTLDGLCAGSYTVSVTNANGCVSLATATVSPGQAIDPALTSVPVSCAGACDGSATVAPVGGVAPYTFLWVPGPGAGQGTPQAAGLCAGVYAVTIGDASGCDTTITVLVLEPSPLTTISTVEDTPCSDACEGSITVVPQGGVAPYGFVWTPEPGAGQGTPIASGLCEGTYTLTLTDANGCSWVDSWSIGAPDPLVLQASSTLSECGACNGTATVTISGGTPEHVFLWTQGADIIGTGPEIVGLCSGIYVAEVLDANGCSASVAVPVGDLEGETTTVTNGQTTCPDGCDGAVSVDVDCTDPPCIISWYDGQGNDLGASTPILSDLCAGTYLVLVTNATGCVTADTAFVVEPDPMEPNLSTTVVSCPGACDGTATVGPTGGSPPYAYLWDPEPPAGQGTPQATGLCAGAWSVIITDDDGCSITVGVLIQEPPSIAADLLLEPISCAGQCDGAITLTPQGGTAPYQYAWTPEPPNGQGTNAIGELCAGTWNVMVTDANGCDTTIAVVLDEPAVLAVDVSTVNNTCYGECQGAAGAVVSGGVAPHDLVWTGPDGTIIGQDVDTVDGLCSGAYQLEVTDVNGCNLQVPFSITEADPIDAGLLHTDESCFGPCDGTASVLPTGGSGGYVLLWVPEPPQGQGTGQVSGLCAGTWSVIITDASGCDTTVTFEVLPYQTIADNAGLSQVTCNGACDGAIDLATTGGLGNLTYTWSPEPAEGQGTNSVSGLCPGTWSVAIADAAGCDTIFSYIITEPPLLEVALDTVVPASCSTAPDGAIATTITGGSPPWSIAWTGPDGFSSSEEDPVGLLPGEYLLVVTDTNGCTITQQVTVGALVSVIAEAGPDQEFCAGVSTLLDGSASIGQVGYLWTDDQGVALGTDAIVDPGLLPAGTHTFILTVTDGPCSDSDTVIVVVLDTPLADAGPPRSIFLSGTTQLGGDPTGPPGSTYAWTPDSLLNDPAITDPIADPVQTTWFHVTVTAPNGCVGLDSVLVTVIPDLVIPSGFTPNGDGWNDAWTIDFIHLFPQCEVEIYNRWGELLFQSRGYTAPWDGRYRGGFVPVGTYYYVVKLNDPEFPDAFTGPLTVIR